MSEPAWNDGTASDREAFPKQRAAWWRSGTSRCPDGNYGVSPAPATANMLNIGFVECRAGAFQYPVVQTIAAETP